MVFLLSITSVTEYLKKGSNVGLVLCYDLAVIQDLFWVWPLLNSDDPGRYSTLKGKLPSVQRE